MREEYRAEAADESCISKWLELVSIVSDHFPGLIMEEYTQTLVKNIRRKTALCVKADGNIVGILLFSPEQHCLSCIAVHPEYRRQGIASALTSRLAVEVLKRGKVPFYCCAWSNVASARNAIRCGFRPAWVQLTAKSMAFVDSMNGEEERREII